MRQPILVVADEVLIFRTTDGAQRYLEFPDVKEGISAYDRDSRRIGVQLDERKSRFKFVDLPDQTSDPQGVREHLFRLLAAGGDDRSFRSMSTEQLWTLAESLFRD